jgi:hypothetical protein
MISMHLCLPGSSGRVVSQGQQRQIENAWQHECARVVFLEGGSGSSI